MSAQEGYILKNLNSIRWLIFYAWIFYSKKGKGSQAASQRRWQDSVEKAKLLLSPACASGFGPPSADLDPPTKLSENIILNLLVKMDDTLRSSAY